MGSSIVLCVIIRSRKRKPASKAKEKKPPVYCISFHAPPLYVHILALFREQILLGIGMMRRLCANAKPIFHPINTEESPHRQRSVSAATQPNSEPGCLSDTYGLLVNPLGSADRTVGAGKAFHHEPHENKRA